ncbi:NACHT, LRR and PYD domains-containing protein 3 [Geodia barretti]|uniref:NACHT, LRR and PYD domains-containing protein 3 n=1 Tax=Geodia barretti TaxID=519541 RepID=A0AA35R5B4_GEOBA|nr:NACHT, LRR and PYD domains-containing protein 3 [Geodia barretti]
MDAVFARIRFSDERKRLFLEFVSIFSHDPVYGDLVTKLRREEMTSNASILGTQLKIEHLSLLKDVLTSVSHKYFVLGSMMKVKHCMLVQISEDGCTSDEKLCKVLEYRLRQLPLLTWHDIVSALRSPAVHEQVLASQIESQYIPCSSSQSHPVSDQSSTIDPSSGTNPPLQAFDMRHHHYPYVSQNFPSSVSLATSQPLPHQPYHIPPQLDPDFLVNRQHLYSGSHINYGTTNHPSLLHPQLQPPQHILSPHFPPGRTLTQFDQTLPHFQMYHPPMLESTESVFPTYSPAAKRPRNNSTLSPSYPASEATAGIPPIVNKFIDFVKQTYSAQVVVKDEKWSLSPTVKYINLACIDRKCVKSKEYENVTKAMVHDGNVDVIQETKGPIKFSAIAKGISLPSTAEACAQQVTDKRLILVEGAPGAGKSTFAWEFCRRWMLGKVAQQYHLVLLLRLRDERIRKAKYLEDLLYHPRKHVASAVCDELLTSHALHMLIILEGYDELPDSCRNDPSSLFNELISGKLLPLSTVLVTSRPWATKEIREKEHCRMHQHIEVLGFTKCQIKEYIKETVPKEQVNDLNSYLERHPQIRCGMYIPLNSAIVVAVYKEGVQCDHDKLPCTLTELYSCYIEIWIRRHLRRTNTKQNEGGTFVIPGIINLSVSKEVHKNFVSMCELAYTGIIGSDDEVKLIFSESELPPNFDNLGLMDSVTELYVTGQTSSSHNFLHLTFQEFFAAVHISTMPEEQQLQYFKKSKTDGSEKEGRLRVVLRFLAGLRNLDCFTRETVNYIVKFPSTPVSSKYQTPCNISVDVDVVNWLFESQSQTAISLLLEECKVEFKAKKSQMMPMDYYSLGYCISHSQCQWVLSLTGRSTVSKEKIVLLANGAVESNGVGKIVLLGDDMLVNLPTTNFNMLFAKWSCLLHLHELSLFTIPQAWPDLSHLLSFSIEGHVADQVCMDLVSYLASTNCLKKLSIKFDYSSDAPTSQHLLELLETVYHHHTLEEKSVKEAACRLTTDDDVKALSQICSLYLDSMRTDFIESVGGLTDDGTIVLAEFLQHKYSLEELDLDFSGTSDIGVVSLAKALYNNSTIYVLKLFGQQYRCEWSSLSLSDPSSQLYTP